VRHGGAGLEPAARKHVVPTYLPLAHPLPQFIYLMTTIHIMTNLGHFAFFFFGRVTGI
jgi:hypothetical protein